MNQNIKNEFPFFLKSILLVLLISGISSALWLTLEDNQGKITLSSIGALFGYNLYGISAFSILITSIFLQPQEDHKNFRQWMTNIIKITIYYSVSLSLIFLLTLLF